MLRAAAISALVGDVAVYAIRRRGTRTHLSGSSGWSESSRRHERVVNDDRAAGAPKVEECVLLFTRPLRSAEHFSSRRTGLLSRYRLDIAGSARKDRSSTPSILAVRPAYPS